MSRYDESAELLTSMENGICTLTLNRPTLGNSLSAELVEGLITALEVCVRDGECHTVVWRGTGRNFCTGFDLSNLSSCTDADLLYRFVRIELLLAKIWCAPLRTIAFVQGRTWGAGADLLVACDHRIADTTASFRFPGVQFGLVLGSRRFAERVGSSFAKECLATNQLVDCAQAASRYLLTRVLSANSWEEYLRRLSDMSKDVSTFGSMSGQVRRDCEDRDLATLVRSAARPGLTARLQAYAASARSANSGPTNG